MLTSCSIKVLLCSLIYFAWIYLSKNEKRRDTRYLSIWHVLHTETSFLLDIPEDLFILFFSIFFSLFSRSQVYIIFYEREKERKRKRLLLFVRTLLHLLYSRQSHHKLIDAINVEIKTAFIIIKIKVGSHNRLRTFFFSSPVYRWVR